MGRFVIILVTGHALRIAWAANSGYTKLHAVTRSYTAVSGHALRIAPAVLGQLTAVTQGALNKLRLAAVGPTSASLSMLCVGLQRISRRLLASALRVSAPYH